VGKKRGFRLSKRGGETPPVKVRGSEREEGKLRLFLPRNGVRRLTQNPGGRERKKKDGEEKEKEGQTGGRGSLTGADRSSGEVGASQGGKRETGIGWKRKGSASTSFRSKNPRWERPGEKRKKKKGMIKNKRV